MQYADEQAGLRRIFLAGTKKRGRVRVFGRQAVKVSLFLCVFGGRAVKETTRYVGLYGVIFSGLSETSGQTEIVVCSAFTAFFFPA